MKKTQSGNEIWSVYVILQKKNFHRNILQRGWISNSSHVNIYIWTRNLTVIDLISLTDSTSLIPQTLSFTKLVLEGLASRAASNPERFELLENN